VTSATPRLLVAASYYPPDVGGLERYAYEMAAIAHQAGYEVTVISSGEGKELRRETIDGISIYRLPTLLTVQNTPISPRWPTMIRQILTEEAPDVINVHLPVPYLGDLVVQAAKNIPRIVTYHSGSMKKHHLVTDAAIELYERCVLPSVLKKADALICPSEFVQDTFLRRYAGKSTHIPPGVDVSIFSRRAVAPDENKIIFIGNYSYEWKGLAYLRQAIDLLPSARLVVVGSGTPVAHPRTTYLGLRHGDELVRELQSSQVLVLPSITDAESFGMVLIEAMACGVAVVGSDIGGIPHTITNEVDGLLAEPRSATALAQAITRILSDPALERRLTENAYQKVLRDYTWPVQGPKYLATLDRVRHGATSAAV
jgi:glycosyltransferase involved in cell wall biosynthesis